MLKVRKINNQDQYKVYNTDTNEVLGYYPTKREANKVIRSGGAVSAASFKKILGNTYKKDRPNDIPGYSIDEKLSGQRVKTYVNNDSGEVVFAIRGTKGSKDVLTDMKLFFTPKNKLKKLDRFKYADKMLKEAEKKYGTENISVIGHSLGAKVAETIGSEKNKNIITYNKPVLPFEKIRDKSNQVDIKTSLDPVSMLDRPDSNDIVLKSKTMNPLKEHSLAALDNTLDDELMIGKGLLGKLMRKKRRG